jgi:ATP-dependent DNA helicase RecQ
MSSEALNAAQEVLGTRSFRGKQQSASAVEAILAGVDVVYVFPTGCGKSAVFQAAALCSEGVTIVVSPLLGLQREQVEKLGVAGVSVIVACGGKLDGVCDIRTVQLVYTTPEQLWVDSLLVEHLEREGVRVMRTVVDEAHVIQDWAEFSCVCHG